MILNTLTLTTMFVKTRMSAATPRGTDAIQTLSVKTWTQATSAIATLDTIIAQTLSKKFLALAVKIEMNAKKTHLAV